MVKSEVSVGNFPSVSLGPEPFGRGSGLPNGLPHVLIFGFPPCLSLARGLYLFSEGLCGGFLPKGSIMAWVSPLVGGTHSVPSRDSTKFPINN